MSVASISGPLKLIALASPISYRAEMALYNGNPVCGSCPQNLIKAAPVLRKIR